ncbi:MAG: hypothetical protein ACOYIR_05815 [Christensenellales bacterium]
MSKRIRTNKEIFAIKGIGLNLSDLPETQRPAVTEFFSQLDRRLLLPKKQKRAMIGDFAAALSYYARMGVSIEEALRRLNPQRLGGFYSRPPVLWFPLDAAAKIYPLSMKRHTMSVFRLSVYFKEDVVPELLQMALTFAIKRFPSFATTVKNGVFWHYLDASKRRYDVEPETERPCAPLSVWASGSQSFRVLYDKNRMSVEFFHILTDGAGGMKFISTLAAEYLRLLGHSIPCSGNVLDIDEIPPVEETENGFDLAEPTARISGFADSPALQMSGALSFLKPCQVLHFELSSAQLLSVARGKQASVTAFLLALIFVAARYATDEQRGNIHIQVPVNLRKYYDSETIRNFSLYCSVKLPVHRISDVDALIPEIAVQLAEKTAKQPMNEMMNAANALVRSLKFVPLFVKRPVARLIYGFLGDKVFTTTLSNLGVVNFPKEMTPHIEKLDFVLGTGVTNRAACSMVTFEDKAVLTVTKLTCDPSFEEKLLQLFHAEGLHPKVYGSDRYED